MKFNVSSYNAKQCLEVYLQYAYKIVVTRQILVAYVNQQMERIKHRNKIFMEMVSTDKPSAKGRKADIKTDTGMQN